MSEHNCDGWDSCPNPAHKAPTLTDFLLARIAEDEAVSLACTQGWVGPESMGAIEGSDTVMVSPKRVYVECEAKRQIVQAADYEGITDDFTLRTLASIYADHPEYQEAWKP